MSDFGGEKNRIEWLDVVKAIAILGTVGIHTFAGRSLLLSISYSVFPLFWIVSGYTIRPCNGIRGLINTTIKDIKKMIIPSFFVCLLSGVIATLLGEYCNWQTLTNNLIDSALFFVSPNSGMLWFFWALLWAKLLYRIMLKLGVFRYIPMAVLIVAALIFSPSYRLPMMIDVAPIGMLFLEFGHLLKEADNKLQSAPRKIQYCLEAIVLAVSVLGSIYLTWQRRLYIDLAGRDYTLMALMQCICLMLLVLLICRVISQTPLVEPMSELGQHTLGFLLLHYLDGYWISPIVEKLFDVIGFSNDFIYYGIRVVLLIIVTLICVKIQDRFYYYINHGKH